MKSRRELFEEQLRDLQKDISSLSNKLATPSTTAASTTNDLRRPSVDFTNGSGKSRHNNATRLLSSEEDLIAMLERSKEELRVMKKERDDAIYKSEQFSKEVEELRKELTESLRLKTAYNYLKQDYESLKVSLESSERIRKQQKELIALLQRSHLVHGDTASTISFGSNASAHDKHPPPIAEGQNRRAPVYNSQPQPTGGDIGIAEPRLSHPETHDQQHHYYNNHHHQHTNGATAITVTASKNTVGSNSNSNSNVVADSRLRHSKKKQSDSSKSTATKQRKSSSSSSSGRQHDNLDIFLSAAPPSDLSSLVSAVSNTQPLSSFSHDQAQAQYLQQQQQQQGSFVPYYERSYPPTSYHRTPLQSDNHVNSSKEVSFSRQLIAPSPNPKNQPIPLPSTGDAMQHTHRPSSHRGRGVTTKAAASLTRRSSQSSLPINAHYDAMHSHNQLKGKPPRYPHTPSHSADDSRIHVVTPSYTQSDSSLRAQANYLNEAPFFQQFEYTGKHPTLTSRSDADLTRSSSSRGASPMRLRSSDPHRAAATGYSGSTRSGSREVTRPRSASAAGGTRASSSRRSSSQPQRLSRS